MQDFKLALNAPNIELEEGDFPYREQMADLIFKIDRDDITEMEKIFSSENGNYRDPKGQKAYKFNFDAMVEVGEQQRPKFPKLQRLFNAIVKLLNAEVEYYTLDLDLEKGPMFEALVYVFNEVGEGSRQTKFFPASIRSSAASRIKSAQRRARGKTKVGREGKLHDEINRKYRNILRNYESNQKSILNARADEEIAELKSKAKEALRTSSKDDEINRTLKNAIAKVKRDLARDIKNIPLNLQRLKDEYGTKIEEASPKDLREIQAKVKEIEDQPLEGERARETVDWFEAEARRLGLMPPEDEEE